MTFNPMADAVHLGIASSDEYNIHKNNILDLDSRVTTNTSTVNHGSTGNAALDVRVTTLENKVLAGLRRGIYPLTSSNLVSGVSTTETDIPLLHINLAVTSGSLYRINVGIQVTGTVALDTFAVKLRRNSAVTGPLIQSRNVLIPPGLLSAPYLPFYYVPASTTTVDLYFSLQRAAGTGSASVTHSATVKSTLEVLQLGTPGNGIIETPA